MTPKEHHHRHVERDVDRTVEIRELRARHRVVHELLQRRGVVDREAPAARDDHRAVDRRAERQLLDGAHEHAADRAHAEAVAADGHGGRERRIGVGKGRVERRTADRLVELRAEVLVELRAQAPVGEVRAEAHGEPLDGSPAHARRGLDVEDLAVDQVVAGDVSGAVVAVPVAAGGAGHAHGHAEPPVRVDRAGVASEAEQRPDRLLHGARAAVRGVVLQRDGAQTDVELDDVAVPGAHGGRVVEGGRAVGGGRTGEPGADRLRVGRRAREREQQRDGGDGLHQAVRRRRSRNAAAKRRTRPSGAERPPADALQPLETRLGCSAKPAAPEVTLPAAVAHDDLELVEVVVVERARGDLDHALVGAPGALAHDLGASVRVDRAEDPAALQRRGLLVGRLPGEHDERVGHDRARLLDDREGRRGAVDDERVDDRDRVLVVIEVDGRHLEHVLAVGRVEAHLAQPARGLVQRLPVEPRAVAEERGRGGVVAALDLEARGAGREQDRRVDERGVGCLGVARIGQVQVDADPLPAALALERRHVEEHARDGVERRRYGQAREALGEHRGDRLADEGAQAGGVHRELELAGLGAQVADLEVVKVEHEAADGGVDRQLGADGAVDVDLDGARGLTGHVHTHRHVQLAERDLRDVVALAAEARDHRRLDVEADVDGRALR